MGPGAQGFRIIITGGEIPLPVRGISPRQLQGVQEVPVEILEEDSEVLLLAELPGAERETTHLQLTGSALRIAAQAGDIRYHAIARLPPVQPDTLLYTLKNGVLEIRLKRRDPLP